MSVPLCLGFPQYVYNISFFLWRFVALRTVYIGFIDWSFFRWQREFFFFFLFLELVERILNIDTHLTIDVYVFSNTLQQM